MGRLWVLMTEMYGHKWTSVHGTSDASGTWSKVLAGMTGQQIAMGMQALAAGSDAWPPSAPEFRAMCESSAHLLGMPDVDAAFSECTKASHAPTLHKWSHELVRLAGKATGWWEIRNNVPNAAALRKRFGSAYAVLFGKLQRGDPLEEPRKMIEHEGAELTPEQAERRSIQLANQIARDQGLDEKTPAELRADLLAKMGIKRGEDHGA